VCRDMDRLRTGLNQRLRAFGYRSGSVDHVVRHDAVLAIDIADDVRDLGTLCSGRPLCMMASEAPSMSESFLHALARPTSGETTTMFSRPRPSK